MTTTEPLVLRTDRADGLTTLTLNRPGPVFQRRDGEWVYRHDPTRIAF